MKVSRSIIAAYNAIFVAIAVIFFNAYIVGFFALIPVLYIVFLKPTGKWNEPAKE